jgi:hypothetical protein
VNLSRLSLVATFLFLMIAPTVQAQAPGPKDELAVPPESGVSINLLADYVAEWDTTLGMALNLSRVTPEETEFESLGTELWVAESGTATIVLQDGRRIELSRQGGGVVIDTADPFTIEFGEEECASALRLEVVTSFGMEVGSEVEGPVLAGPPTSACPPDGPLIEVSDLTAPEMPGRLFLAEVEFPEFAFLEPRVYSGPIAWTPLEGELGVPGLDGVSTALQAGSSVAIQPGVQTGMANNRGNPARAYLVGALQRDGLASGAASAEAAPTASPTQTSSVTGNAYTSPTYGYSISWDSAWSVMSEFSEGGSDALKLGNGISEVNLTSYGDYAGGAEGCLADIESSLTASEGYSNVEPMNGSFGVPIRGAEAGRAFAVHTLTYTTAEFSGDYVEYIECRDLVPGQSVLAIIHFSPVDQWESEQETVAKLLESLTLQGE